VCTGAEVLANCMLVAGVLASLISALTQHRLFRSVRVEFPHVWSELGKRPCWFCNGDADPEYSLASWYLVMQAEYRLLPESQTRRLGYQAWCSAYAAVAVLVVFGFVICVTQVSPSFACVFRSAHS
jgi:hypothetical protein